jgi:hypothetical protein
LTRRRKVLAIEHGNTVGPHWPHAKIAPSSMYIPREALFHSLIVEERRCVYYRKYR